MFGVAFDPVHEPDPARFAGVHRDDGLAVAIRGLPSLVRADLADEDAPSGP